MKILSAPFRAEASGDTNRPLELYDLYLDNTTLHIVNYDMNLTYFDPQGVSQTYIALPVSREVYERTVDNQVNSIVVGIANVDRSMSAYLAETEFRGRRIVVRKVFSNLLTSSGDSTIIFDGVMDTPAASEETIQLNAVDRIGSLNRESPRRWYQLLCNYKFGDDWCFQGKTSGDMYDTNRYSCIGGSTDTRIVSSSLTQSGDYWIDGEIVVTSGLNALKKRKVISSNPSGTYVNLDINLPYTLSSGDAFTIRRGCDKTHFRCSGDFNNDLNFGGFDTIPQEMVIQ